MLVDIGSGRVLEQRRADLSWVPASVTKVMTAYVAFEEMAAGRLVADRRFTVSPMVARDWSGVGTTMWLQQGETVTTHQLLRGIMTASANDAAVALAEGYAGGIDQWSFLMNDAARRLGMTNSHYNTPNGWPDEGQTYVSAADLVKLASAMIRNYPEYYAMYSGRREMPWRGGTLFSHDPITGRIAGADGIKTGYTREAGYNFVGSAKRGNRRLVLVIAGAKSGPVRARAAKAMLEWGFNAWKARPLFRQGQIVGNARVQGGTIATVPLVAMQPVYATVPLQGSEPISLRIVYKGPIHAPIMEKSPIAELEITTGDAPPSRVPLRAAVSVPQGTWMDRLRIGFMNMVS